MKPNALAFPAAPRPSAEALPQPALDRSSRVTTLPHPAVAQRMKAVREAFLQQRLAHQKRRLWRFYLEHNLFEEARDSRLLMIEHLRSACQQWRVTLGTTR